MWVLGFIIAFLSGSSNSGSGSGSGSSSSNSNSGYSTDGQSFLNDNWMLILIIICGILLFFLILGIISWYIKSRANAGLLHACKEEIEKKKIASYKEYWKLGKPFVKDFMLADLTIIVIGFLAVLVMALMTLLLRIPIINIFVVLFLFMWMILMLFGGIIATILYKFVYINIVYKGMHYKEAIYEAWNLFKKYYLNIGLGFLVYALTSIVYYSVFVLVIIFISIIIFLPLFAGFITALVLENYVVAGVTVLLLLLASILLKVIFSILESPYKVFESYYWSEIYMALQLGSIN